MFKIYQIALILLSTSAYASEPQKLIDTLRASITQSQQSLCSVGLRGMVCRTEFEGLKVKLSGIEARQNKEGNAETAREIEQGYAVLLKKYGK